MLYLFGLLAGIWSAPPAATQTVAEQFGQEAVDTIALARDRGAFFEWSESRGITSPAHVVARGRRVLVLDDRSMHVWVLDDSGRELGRFGRAGSGPAEFRRLSWGFISDDGRYWIYDRAQARLSVWEPDFELADSYRIVNPSVWGAFAALTSGRIVTPAAGYEGDMIRIRDAEDLTASETLMRRSGPPEIPPDHPIAVDLVAAANGRLAVFEGATGILTWVDAATGSLAPPVVQLPAWVRRQLDEGFASYRETGFTPTAYGIRLQVADGDQAVITLIRSVDGGVVGAVVREDHMSLIAVPGDESLLRPGGVRAITAFGECFLFSTEYGVERFCPTGRR